MMVSKYFLANAGLKTKKIPIIHLFDLLFVYKSLSQQSMSAFVVECDWGYLDIFLSYSKLQWQYPIVSTLFHYPPPPHRSTSFVTQFVRVLTPKYILKTFFLVFFLLIIPHFGGKIVPKAVMPLPKIATRGNASQLLPPTSWIRACQRVQNVGRNDFISKKEVLGNSQNLPLPSHSLSFNLIKPFSEHFSKPSNRPDIHHRIR